MPVSPNFKKCIFVLFFSALHVFNYVFLDHVLQARGKQKKLTSPGAHPTRFACGRTLPPTPLFIQFVSHDPDLLPGQLPGFEILLFLL